MDNVLSLVNINKDVFETHVLTRLTGTDALNLISSCKRLYAYKPFVINMVTIQISQSEQDLDIILKLSQIGLVMGENILRGMNDHIKPFSPHCYHVYLPSLDAFLQAFRMCVGKFQENDKVLTITLNDISDGNVSQQFSSICLVSKNHYDNTDYYRLSWQNFDNPTDVLSHLSLDYLQCGLYQGQLFRTRACLESHMSGTVLQGFQIPNSDKLDRARLRGFKSGIIGNETKIKQNAHNDLTEDYLKSVVGTYFIPSSPQPRHPFRFDDIKIIGLEVVKDSLERSEHLQSESRRMNIVCQAPGLTFLTPAISFEVNAISHDKDGKCVQIEPVRLSDELTIHKCRLMTRFTSRLGKQKVEVKFQITNHSNKDMGVTIHMFICSFLDSNAKTFSLADKVQVTT